MEQEQKAWVDQDIAEIETALKEFSFDGEILEALFQRVLTRQAETVDGLDLGMSPLFAGESHAQKAQICRGNLSLLWQRLTAFRDNGYQNIGFTANPAYEKRLEEAFNHVRRQSETLGLPERVLEEYLSNLDEMQQVGMETMSDVAKWNRLRPYLVWLSGKDLRAAHLMLPLFLLILRQ